MPMASRKPKRRQAHIAGTGLHFAKMRAASAMKPRPADISRPKPEAMAVDRYAPDTPHSAPQMIIAW